MARDSVGGRRRRSPPRHRRASHARAGATRGSGSASLIVAVSVVAGARLLAAADDTVAVWAVAVRPGAGRRADRGRPGRRSGSGSPTPTTSPATSPSTTSCRPTSQLVHGRRRRRAAAAGRGRHGRRAADTVELPVAVEAEQVPPSVRAGLGRRRLPARHADERRGTRRARAVRRWPSVTVVDAPRSATAFGATTGRASSCWRCPSDDAARVLRRAGRARRPRCSPSSPGLSVADRSSS